MRLSQHTICELQTINKVFVLQFVYDTMRLPGRRQRERLQSETKTVTCPVCTELTSVTVQKRDTLRYIEGPNGVKREITEFSNQTAKDKSTTVREREECEACESVLHLTKTYIPQ